MRKVNNILSFTFTFFILTGSIFVFNPILGDITESDPSGDVVRVDYGVPTGWVSKPSIDLLQFELNATESTISLDFVGEPTPDDYHSYMIEIEWDSSGTNRTECYAGAKNSTNIDNGSYTYLENSTQTILNETILNNYTISGNTLAFENITLSLIEDTSNPYDLFVLCIENYTYEITTSFRANKKSIKEITFDPHISFFDGLGNSCPYTFVPPSSSDSQTPGGGGIPLYCILICALTIGIPIIIIRNKKKVQ